MDAEVTREAELKFTAPPGATPPRLDDVGAWTPWRRIDLRATYYDTPGLDLAGNRRTLRRRTGGDDAGWHLKSPASDGARTETRLPLEAGADGRVPTALRDALGVIVAGRPLLPMATLHTVRDEAGLLGADGRLRAFLCSDEVTATVGADETRWHEIEVELAPGEPDETLGVLADALRQAGCEPAAHASKAGKVLGSVVPAGASEIASSAGDLVLAYAARQLGSLQTQEAGVRLDAPDAVHKSRVAARRLRSVLRRCAPILDAEYVGRLDAELRWYGQVAGAPRDAEVLREHLEAALDSLDARAVEGPVAQRLLADLGRRHAEAHEALVAELDGARYDELMQHLAGLLLRRPVRDVGLLPSEFVLSDLVEAAIGRVRHRYRRASAAPEHLEAWHEVRKAAKAVRYCCEAVAEAYGGDASATAKRWEAVTEALGDAQDTVVAAEVLGRLAQDADGRGELTHTYDLLITRQADKRAVSLAAGRAALDVALADRLTWLR